MSAQKLAIHFIVIVLISISIALALSSLKQSLPWWILYLIAANIWTFIVYGWDKRMAIKGKQRTPESILHTLALAGGVFGALSGQRFFRHKTQKQSFHIMLLGDFNSLLCNYLDRRLEKLRLEHYLYDPLSQVPVRLTETYGPTYSYFGWSCKN